MSQHFFADVTAGQVLQFGTAVFGLLGLIFSGRAWRIGKRALGVVDRIASNVGHSDKDKAGLSNGRNLTEKIESLDDSMNSLKEAFRIHVDKERAREIAVDLSTIPSGRHADDQ